MLTKAIEDSNVEDFLKSHHQSWRKVMRHVVGVVETTPDSSIISPTLPTTFPLPVESWYRVVVAHYVRYWSRRGHVRRCLMPTVRCTAWTTQTWRRTPSDMDPFLQGEKTHESRIILVPILYRLSCRSATREAVTDMNKQRRWFIRLLSPKRKRPRHRMKKAVVRFCTCVIVWRVYLIVYVRVQQIRSN